jgi:hypothetical protein
MLAERSQPRAQRGITLLGLLFWAVLVAFVALIGMRVLPTINEYLTIQRAVNKVAGEGLATVPEIRAAFDRKDLKITKEDDRVVIRFAYQKEIEIFSPVFLLIKYEGASKPK